LLFLLEQRFSTAARLISIHVQYWNSLEGYRIMASRLPAWHCG